MKRTNTKKKRNGQQTREKMRNKEQKKKSISIYMYLRVTHHE